MWAKLLRTKFFSLTILLLASIITSNISIASNLAFGDVNNGTKHAPDRLLVKFKASVSEGTQNTALAKNKAVKIDVVPRINVKIIKVAANELDSVETALRNNPSVQYVEKDYLLEPLALPTDPYFSKQWHLSTIAAPNAWDISKGDNAVIAILDTGVDPAHPDLKNKLLPGYNFYDNNNNWSDVCGHGTAVAGTAAAMTNNGEGVAGVAWNAKILPIRITDTSCYGYYSTMAKGIIFAADNGARSANISFHIFDGFALKDAAKYMYDKGGWVVAAGGNSGSLQNYNDNPYIISVGATGPTDQITGFSTFGPYIDFAAPGYGIYTTLRGNSYGPVSGTSFSSPIVAGLIALMVSKNSNATPDQIYDALKNSAADLGVGGRDYYYGWGRVDAYKSLQALDGVVIKDTVPPLVISPPNEIVTALSANGAIVNYPPATATDNVGVTSGPTCVPPSGSTFPIGITTVTCTASDAAGNIGSATFTISINKMVQNDTTPPVISITSPTGGSSTGIRVQGAITVSVSASDASGIGKIEMYIDNILLTTLTNPPYDFRWDTTGVSDGYHTITTKAYDAYGNTSSAAIRVKVFNNHP